MKLSFILVCAFVASLFCLSAPGNAQSFPPAWNNTAKYAPGDLVTDYGNIYRCLKAVATPYLDPSKTYANWELHYVRNNTTLLIGVNQAFPTFTTAWNYALNAAIAQGVYLHLNISSNEGDYAQTFTSQLNLDHPFGGNISIIGDDPAKIVLTFSNCNGVIIDSGHALASLEYVTLNATFTDPVGLFGLTATTNAVLKNVYDVPMTGFEFPVYASYGASITLGDETLSGISIGIKADYGATISAQSCNIENSPAGVGVSAIDGGIVNFESGTTSHCEIGIQAGLRGYIDATYSTCSNNTQDIVAYDGGAVSAMTATYSESKTEVDSHGSFIFTS